MVPRAKKNLHECAFHLEGMQGASHFEELEISFLAFVRAARNATWSLLKEFKTNPKYRDKFLEWYGDGHSPVTGTKSFEMKNDDLCQFFNKIRDEIEHEGINGLRASTRVGSLRLPADLIDPPKDARFEISNRGMYYRVNKGTPREDIIPARTRGKVATLITISGTPNTHLNLNIKGKNILELSDIYYEYLKTLVEEWTGIINNS